MSPAEGEEELSAAPGDEAGTRHDAFRMDPHPVDVRALMARTVADLYSHLVTRPTGRAVRLAIEQQLDELERPVLSLVDFSSVAILDYSCADEVVAKLVLALREGMGGGRAWVIFRGLRDFHRDPVEAVLERHALVAVAQSAEGEAAELLGEPHPLDRQLWEEVEARGRIPARDLAALAPTGTEASHRLDALLEARLVFRHPQSGDLLALSALALELAPPSRDPSSAAAPTGDSASPPDPPAHPGPPASPGDLA
jgi:hypothetical protein